MGKEIERKFLVKSFPESLKQNAGKKHLVQGYLALEQDGHEVRLRQAGDRFWMTVKSAGELERREYEIELSREQFETMWPATKGRRLEKDRYLVRQDEITFEVDVYASPLRGLIVAEVEFDSESEASGFSKPDWFGREVTELSFLKNRRLLEFENFEDLQDELPEP